MKKIFLLACISLSLFALSYPKIPDPPKEYPEGKLGEYVKLGEIIMKNTASHPLSKDFVGNKLNCSDCHIQEGKSKSLGTLIGTAAVFPAFSKREGSIQSLEDRINNCFMRSMNGIRPINGTKLSLALSAYVAWLSSNLPIKLNAKKPVNNYYSSIWPIKKASALIKKASHENYLKGKALYAKKCAACHLADGSGGAFAPLWGKDSFNTGAGLSKLNKMASWMIYNMPKGDEGSLSLEEAVDLSIYIDAQARPSFDLKAHLQKGVFYNSIKTSEKSDVRSNFKAFGLDIDKIRGDKLIK